MKTLNPVTIERVTEFSETPNITNSYLQTERHARTSERYHAIQPAMIGSVLAENNFKLVSLLTGKAKHSDLANFQRTVSRYRSTDTFEIEGLHLDIIYISKHMGRGCDELILGFFRGVCANQWNAGTNVEVIKIRHTANAIEGLREGIAKILAERPKLIESIRKMQQTNLAKEQINELALEYAKIRLKDVKNLEKFDHTLLTSARRESDLGTDLFTVANVLQENAVRSQLPYTVNSVDKKGNPVLRSMTTRVVKESSVKLVELNSEFFEAALKLVA